MKFIVQPAGETMQVPALTAVTETPDGLAYGGAVPRQSGLTVASGPASGSGISSPCGPAATIFAWSSSVSHEGRGRSSVRASSARATPAPTTSNAAATRPATVSSLRMDPPLDQFSSAASPAALGSAHGDNREPLARFLRTLNLYMLQTISVGRPETQSAAPLKSCGGRRGRMSSALRTSFPAKLTMSLAGS